MTTPEPEPSTWSALVERLDEAEAHLRDPDPYRRQAAHDARAMVYDGLAAQTSDSVYHAACIRAAICDRTSAARIRWQHGIPTLYPRTEAHLLGFGQCPECGRPWQLSTAGACPHCPTLQHGPTPTSAAAAAELPATSVDITTWDQPDGADDF
jgi:hypothetical protein